MSMTRPSIAPIPIGPAVLAVILLSVLLPLAVSADMREADSLNWCGTQILWEQQRAAQGYNAQAAQYACPEYGPCDDPEVRDSWTPDGGAPFTYIRLAIHILAETDGSNPITTEAEVQHAVDLLNQYYLPARIQFDHAFDQINASDWRLLSTQEVDGMKTITARDPQHWLNVWVTQVDFGYSFGTFPFSADALEATGGIVLGHFHWGGSNYTTFAHEIGHCLGLWHTFNGVDEVSECGPCYERVNATDRDLLGDRCSDTPPTPTWNQCSSASGSDPCSGLGWGYTQPENYMGYVPSWCRSLFTPQQIGRIHCWTDLLLSGWKSPVIIQAAPTFGPAPLTVAFTGSSFRTVTSRQWDFGGDGTSSDPAPDHTFTQAGRYITTLEINTPDGVYEEVRDDHIWVYADTAAVEQAAIAPGDPIRVDIAVTNHVPLSEMILPFNWSAENGLSLDSISTAGLRSEAFEVQALIDVDNVNRRGAVQLSATADGQPPYCEPGGGPVVSLYFTSSTGLTDTTRIEPAGYGPVSFVFSTERGFYTPAAVAGAVFSAGCCVGFVGNANKSVDEEPTVGDVSAMIDMLFQSGTEVACMAEADINQSGGADPVRADVTVGDISALIDYLFITGPSLGLADCR